MFLWNVRSFLARRNPFACDLPRTRCQIVTRLFDTKKGDWAILVNENTSHYDTSFFEDINNDASRDRPAQ